MLKTFIHLLFASLILSTSAIAAPLFKKGSMEVGGSLATPTIITGGGSKIGMGLGFSFGFFASTSLSLGLAANIDNSDITEKNMPWRSRLKAFGKYYFHLGAGIRSYVGAGFGAANVDSKYSPAISAQGGLILPLTGRLALDVTIPAEVIFAEGHFVLTIPSPHVGVRAFF